MELPNNGHAIDLAKEERFMVFLRSERRIYAYVLALVAQRQDAEDLLQDISRVMWQEVSADNFTGEGDFAAWGHRHCTLSRA